MTVKQALIVGVVLWILVIPYCQGFLGAAIEDFRRWKSRR
jgi:hypothetical protein